MNWCFVSSILNDCVLERELEVCTISLRSTLGLNFERTRKTSKPRKKKISTLTNKQTNKQKTGDRNNFTRVNNTNHTGTKVCAS